MGISGRSFLLRKMGGPEGLPLPRALAGLTEYVLERRWRTAREVSGFGMRMLLACQAGIAHCAEGPRTDF